MTKPKGWKAIKDRRIHKRQKFNPDHQFVENAVDDYLKHGGKIKLIVPGDIDVDKIPAIPGEVDEFLAGL